MIAKGKVHKFGDNVDTDVIIPARYLNKSDEAWLASHCMEDIDKDFVNKVQPGDIILLHDIYATSVDAALQIVDTLEEQGYWLVTVEELLILGGIQPQEGVLYRSAGK